MEKTKLNRGADECKEVDFQAHRRKINASFSLLVLFSAFTHQPEKWKSLCVAIKSQRGDGVTRAIRPLRAQTLTSSCPIQQLPLTPFASSFYHIYFYTSSCQEFVFTYLFICDFSTFFQKFNTENILHSKSPLHHLIFFTIFLIII